MNLRADAALDFPAGSMFWARGAALRPLLDLGLSFDDFPAETGQTDGTLAHAIERLFLHSCERAGYGWLKIANPALYFRTDTIVQIRSAEDLDRYVARHCFWLTGPTAPPPARRCAASPPDGSAGIARAPARAPHVAGQGGRVMPDPALVEECSSLVPAASPCATGLEAAQRGVKSPESTGQDRPGIPLR